MATILLQVAGAAIGSLLGPVGSALGAAAGALAGYTIDQALINGTRRIEGPRLTGARPFTAEEGVAIPRVYGTARVGGIMIWATRFEEASSTSRQGGKTGPKVTEYSYFANVAFALCEGEIAGIRRVWVDGREIDRDTIEMRVLRGRETQGVDPLISTKQGAGNAPAYRGTAYVVLERFALADYGNRIPQFQFEVLRPVGSLPQEIRAVSLIPGATEYGLSPSLVTRQRRQGDTEAVNRNVLFGESDLVASLDELQMLCPNLKHVALVVAWFGDDLRAGECRIRPAVTTSNGSGFSKPWVVSGVSRASAMVVSTHDGGASYGGTPSDRSVMDAIAEIKSRGLKVTLYPFVMMDVPEDNDLPDPYGNPSQPAYPWRGRITCEPAPLVSGTADRTAEAREQVEDFCGNALASQFHAMADTINFTGTSGDWGYRRFILHNARLAQAAGGVDAFLIGSELRGLTTLRDEDDEFPFVDALRSLAGDVRGILGSSTKITYGADWSEYFGYHPLDGTGDVYFHLDPLWADAAIDAVGIDNYMPLSDWRDADYAAGNPDGFAGPYDAAGMRAAVAGGEGFDWYYPTYEARRSRDRSPIADGAFEKPWVFRAKDLKSWWSQPHYNRIAGEEADEPTAWVPESKPYHFTEIGCPATDKGPNQPNVFADPKSAEGGLPYFSSGGRSDFAQQRFLATHHAHWNPASDTFEETDNPVSTVYGGRMVDPERLYVWAWDARPYPAFPLRSDLWSDGGNWHYGHWLNGRIGNPSVGELINAILADHGLPPATVESVEGTVHGYVDRRAGLGAVFARSADRPFRARGDRDGAGACLPRRDGTGGDGANLRDGVGWPRRGDGDGQVARPSAAERSSAQLPRSAGRVPDGFGQPDEVRRAGPQPARDRFSGLTGSGTGQGADRQLAAARMGRARKHRVCRGAAQCRDRAGRHRSPACIPRWTISSPRSRTGWCAGFRRARSCAPRRPHGNQPIRTRYRHRCRSSGSRWRCSSTCRWDWRAAPPKSTSASLPGKASGKARRFLPRPRIPASPSAPRSTNPPTSAFWSRRCRRACAGASTSRWRSWSSFITARFRASAVRSF